MSSYCELQPWGESAYKIVENSYTSFKTERAYIELITNHHFGRMLFIDRVLQSCEKDELLYHSTLVSLAHVEGGNVLIIGGAEGATLREVLFYPVASVDMVDWDQKLVEYMKEFEPSWSKSAFDSPRARLIFADIHDYLHDCSTLYNSIVIDLLDIETDADMKMMLFIMQKCLNLVKIGGCISCNIGNSIEMVRKLQDSLSPSKGCIESSVSSVFIPSFQELWYFLSIRRVS